MKVHITYTFSEVQSEEICKDIVNDIVNKMFMQENSTLEITHDEEHDQATLKRKHYEDGNYTVPNRNDVQAQSDIKKKYKIDYEDLEKIMKEEMYEFDRKIALGEAIEIFLRKGEVKQAALSKDKQEALELYRNEDDEYDLYKDTVLYPWQEELMKHMNPTYRQVIWVVGEKTNEGKNIFKNISKRCMDHVVLLMGYISKQVPNTFANL